MKRRRPYLLQRHIVVDRCQSSLVSKICLSFACDFSFSESGDLGRFGGIGDADPTFSPNVISRNHTSRMSKVYEKVQNKSDIRRIPAVR